MLTLTRLNTPGNGPVDFVLSARPVEWGFLLAAYGELDVAALPRLRDELERALASGVTRIVLDFSEVSFIDSLSLAAVVAAKRRLGSNGRLAVVVRQPYVMLIFEACGLDSVVALFETRDEAVAHVRG